MSITLRRPMFRGGKPEVYGTGITSNLEPRKNYYEGSTYDEAGVMPLPPQKPNIPSPNMPTVEQPQADPMAREKYARQYGESIRQQMTPGYREQVLDFLTAFGASAAPAGEYQTFGSALGKTGANFASLFEPKMSAARKAGVEAYATALKDADPEKLLEYQKIARDFWKIESSKPENQRQFKNYDQVLEAVIREKVFGKEKDDSATLIKQFENYYTTEKGKKPLVARALALVDLRSMRDPNFAMAIGGEAFEGAIDYDIFDRTEDGFKLKPTQRKNAINTNATFVDIYTNDIFRYDGQGNLIKLDI